MKKTSLEQKREIEQFHKEGKTAPEISIALGMKIRTVRKWLSRIKKGIRYTLQWDDHRKAFCPLILNLYAP